MKALSAFQQAQLATTLANALRHPFYTRHWAGIDLQASEPEAVLASLPCVGKRHLEHEIEPMLNDGDEVVGVSFSSGSTGRVVSRYTTRREAQQMERLLAPAPAAEQGVGIPCKSVHLEFLSSWHGVSVTRAGRQAVTLPGNAADEARMHRTLALMRKPVRAHGVEPFVSTMSGGLVGIYSFTRFLQDAGVDRDEFTMRLVGVFGGYLGSRRRRVLEEYWGCPVVDSFSVSECRGKAIVCDRCGYLSFEPQLIAQAIALEEDAVIESGVGRLCLTELHPFGIAQPLIKYLTGDLVEYIPAGQACCDAHQGGLRRLGRLETSIFGPVRGAQALLLSSQELYDVFDCEGVFREDTDSSVRLAGVDDLGQPHVCARIDEGAGGPALRLSYKPDGDCIDATPGLTRQVIKRIERRLGGRLPGLEVEVVADPRARGPITKFA